MSPTHDMIIDNSTGANVRADINNALAALVSNSSSSSEPSTKYAYQFWADTTTGILKIRNSSNNAWIELFQLDGTLTLEDGSASTPALAFRDDLDTGVFSSEPNAFNIATAGVERIEFGTTECVVNDTGADVDFRIEGDTDANLFKVDAGNDRIGIGTSSPSVKTQILVSDTTAYSASTISANQFQLSITNSGANGVAGILLATEPSSGNGGHCGIRALSTASGSSALTFSTRGSNTQAERLRIDASGRVIIGSTSTIGNTYSNNFTISESTGNAGMQIEGNNSNSNFASIYFGDAGHRQKHYIESQLGTNGQLNIGTIGTGAIKLTNSGGTLVRFDSEGLKFGSDTATANALHDYEQGTWSPAFYPHTGSFATYVASTSAFYIKVGRLVNVWCQINVSSLDTTGGSVQVRISGLPYLAATGDGIDGGTMNVNYYTNLSGMGDQVPSGYVANNTTFIVMIRSGGNGQNTFAPSNLGTTNFYMHMSYYSAA